jgi:hypothetical protein
MEFNNGNQIARNALRSDALGPQDEMGVVLWDGRERWLFPLGPVGDRKEKGRMISGMNQGDLPNFENVMHMAYAVIEGNPGLRDSKANLKHMIVFSDGDPGAPSDGLMQSIVNDKVTVSSVLIAGHAGPDTMIKIADQGRGRFYDVRDPSQLPQIFLKEAMVILKSAIFEEPFTPQVAVNSEVLRGISGGAIPHCAATSARRPRRAPKCRWSRTKAIPCWRTGSSAWVGRSPSPPTPRPSGRRTGWGGASIGSSGPR